WVDPLRAWAAGAVGLGLVAALAAAAVVRPLPVRATLRRVPALAAWTPRSRAGRLARALVAPAAGVALVASPRRTLTVAVAALGALIIVAATAELLGLAAGPGAARPRGRGAGLRRGARVGVVAGVLAAGIALAAAIA